MEFNKRMFLHVLDECNLKTPQFFSNENEYLNKLKLTFKKIKNNCVKYYVPCGTKRICSCCDAITEAIELYLEGNSVDSQKVLDKEFFGFLESKIANTNIQNCIGFLNVSDIISGEEKNNNSNLYRARINLNHELYTDKDMLHVPFSKRSTIKPQRFSISGLTCLYFGSTSYICWMELGKPMENYFEVSSFKFTGDLKILALTVEYEALCIWLNNKYENEYSKKLEQYLEDMLCIIPFSYASSFSVKNNNDRSFYIEYVVPQMIMNFAFRNGFDGVAYLSNKVPFL